MFIHAHQAHFNRKATFGAASKSTGNQVNEMVEKDLNVKASFFLQEERSIRVIFHAEYSIFLHEYYYISVYKVSFQLHNFFLREEFSSYQTYIILKGLGCAAIYYL